MGNIDGNQLNRLNGFIRRLQDAGVLYYQFTQDDEFRQHLRLDLVKDLSAFGSEWGNIAKATTGNLMSPRGLSGRLLELHNEIGGPFRSSPVLRSLREQLERNGIECLERLLTRSRRELAESGIDESTIGLIEEDLSEFGQSLRADDVPVDPLDQLALTPACRNAIRQAGIADFTDLTSRTL